MRFQKNTRSFLVCFVLTKMFVVGAHAETSSVYAPCLNADVGPILEAIRTYEPDWDKRFKSSFDAAFIAEAWVKLETADQRALAIQTIAEAEFVFESWPAAPRSKDELDQLMENAREAGEQDRILAQVQMFSKDGIVAYYSIDPVNPYNPKILCRFIGPRLAEVSSAFADQPDVQTFDNQQVVDWEEALIPEGSGQMTYIAWRHLPEFTPSLPITGLDAFDLRLDFVLSSNE
jgi:hypothetical protein